MAPWSNGGCWCASPRSARDALTCRRSMASVRGDARLPLLALPCRRKLAPAGRPADAHRPITRTPIRLRAFNATIKTASARCLPNHGGYTSTCLTLRGSRSLRRDACGCRERMARARKPRKRSPPPPPGAKLARVAHQEACPSEGRRAFQR